MVAGVIVVSSGAKPFAELLGTSLYVLMASTSFDTFTFASFGRYLPRVILQQIKCLVRAVVWHESCFDRVQGSLSGLRISDSRCSDRRLGIPGGWLSSPDSRTAKHAECDSATSLVNHSKEFLMLENQKRRESFERITEAEVLSAIHYLDPDLKPERTRQGAGTVHGIYITLLTTLTVVLTYICVYF